MVQQTGFKVPLLTLAKWMLSSVCNFLEEKASRATYKLFPEANAPLNMCKNLNIGIHLEVWLVYIFKLILFVCFMSEK